MEIAENLRKLAGDLRKAAECVGNATHREELDPEKIRDFLIFYGGRNLRQGAANEG